ncbi:MAG TPA: PEP-CTERM sorting domain-containing protein [Pirellulales bacterium]|nr:PEP-CTERM sorting domain-containing protein [Pirellulales bacterium]
MAATLGICFVFVGSVIQAGVLDIDFEPPTYTGGTFIASGITNSFNGEGGWDSRFDPNLQVSTTNVIAGTQSLYMTGNSYGVHDASGLGYVDGATYSVLLQPSTANSSDESIVQLGVCTTPGDSSTIQTVSYAIFQNGATSVYNGHTLVSAGASYSANDVLQVTETFNFTAGTFDLSIHDLTSNTTSTTPGNQFYNSFSAAAFNAGAAVGLVSQTSPNGNTVFDNVVVTGSAVPEPSSLALLFVAGLGLVVRRMRRNRAERT